MKQRVPSKFRQLFAPQNEPGWLATSSGKHLWLICGLGMVILVTLVVQGYRLEYAPDIFSDEGVYLLVGMNLAKGLGLVADHQPFVWHPPAYMLIEAAYIWLRNLVNLDPLTTLLATRWLNICFSALTALLLVLLGHRLHSYKAGLIAALLFLMDPYVQRINRRNMLETLAMLSVLFGLYLFFSWRSQPSRWQWIGAGSAFGGAVLTKEPMFLELIALVSMVFLIERAQVRTVMRVATLTFAIYLLYPMWLIAVGQGNAYLVYKRFSLTRIINVVLARSLTSSTVTLPPSTRGGLLDSLWSRFSQYGMSYLLIALAILFTLLLLLYYRQRREVRYLCAWSIFSLAFGLGLGRVSDQYFYYLIVPATVVAGYFLATMLEAQSMRPLRIIQGLLLALFGVMFLSNSLIWAKTYAFGSDNAYMEVVRCIQAHLPPGTMIEASDDVAVYYLSPPYVIRLDRDPRTIINEHARYFILSEKDVQGGYDAMTPQLYTWVIQHSYPLLEREGLSFGKIGLYQLTTTMARGDEPPGVCQTSRVAP